MGISMIFRRFISLQYRIDATEMTSEEIDAMLSRVMPRPLYAGCRDRMMNSFLLWDLSKFAEFAPSQAILLANCEGTRKLAVDLAGEGVRV